MKFIYFLLFTTLFLGCNSEYAGLGRISKLPTLLKQLGTVTAPTGFSTSDGDNCTDIAVDKYENIICVGTTSGSLFRAKDGSVDGYVAKFDRQGKLLWGIQLQSAAGGDDSCTSVGVDNEGNIYCGGITDRVLGTLPVKNKVLVSSVYQWNDRSPSAIDSDAVVAKISSNGKLQWIKQFGTPEDDRCNKIAVSPLGNVYCGSVTKGELGTHAPTGQDEYLSATSANPLVAKIDTNGNLVWARQFGVISMGALNTVHDRCHSITLDQDENVYCGGTTDGSTADVNSSNQFDLMVWVLDKNGFTKNLFQLGTNARDSHPDVLSTDGEEVCAGIAVDKDKNIFCSSFVLTSYAEANGGGQDVLVVKWSQDGTLQWATQLGALTTVQGYGNSGDQIGRSIVPLPDGSVVVAGNTEGSTAAPINSGGDVTLWKFSPDGKLIWGRQYGSSGIEACNRVKADELGNLYCGGTTNGSFGEQGDGSYDIFFMRLNSEGLF